MYIKLTVHVKTFPFSRDIQQCIGSISDTLLWLSQRVMMSALVLVSLLGLIILHLLLASAQCLSFVFCFLEWVHFLFSHFGLTIEQCMYQNSMRPSGHYAWPYLHLSCKWDKMTANILTVVRENKRSPLNVSHNIMHYKITRLNT